MSLATSGTGSCTAGDGGAQTTIRHMCMNLVFHWERPTHHSCPTATASRTRVDQAVSSNNISPRTPYQQRQLLGGTTTGHRRPTTTISDHPRLAATRRAARDHRRAGVRARRPVTGTGDEVLPRVTRAPTRPPFGGRYRHDMVMGSHYGRDHGALRGNKSRNDERMLRTKALQTRRRSPDRSPCAEAMAHKRNGRKYNHHTSDLDVGDWADHRIETTEEAANLIRWVARTEPSAFNFLRSITVKLGSDPTILRTPGEVYVLAKQNTTVELYWIRSTGHRKAPARAASPPAHDPREDELAYLGTALVDGDDTMVILRERADENVKVVSGSHTKLMAAVRLYEAMTHLLWPIGFRISPTEYAHHAHKYAKVYIPDVGSWFTINSLAPRRICVGTLLERLKFLETLIRILSVAGTFNQIAQLGQGQYVFANRALEHYPFLTSNITISHVICWLAQHGIARDGESIAHLESFARSRRNLQCGQNSPGPKEFKLGGVPHSAAEMLGLELGCDILPWTEIEHAALQPDVLSSYPNRPSKAMEID
ncbi:hypothetical protein B0H16DRAFT_1456934 [Mycena metata]|uniref:Uncharacterized protein n=1 Tax=Mycena metata TaxID=1033252 RepID=A0AAD7JCI4_9AGAR|nr:hypothetical protein B0H16DRAFT_1456934 [Mycena metata]